MVPDLDSDREAIVPARNEPKGGSSSGWPEGGSVKSEGSGRGRVPGSSADRESGPWSLETSSPESAISATKESGTAARAARGRFG